MSPGFTAVVFPGLDDTPVDEVAAAIGPELNAIFVFAAAKQRYRVYRPDAPIPALNTLATVNQRDVLFVSLEGSGGASFVWPDLLPGGGLEVTLPPGFTFVGFTGGDGTALSDLVGDASLGVIFRFDATTQAWLTYRPGQPAFLSSFSTADRLTGLFVVNESGDAATLSWDEVGAMP